MRCPGPLPAWFVFDGDLVGLCTACTYHIRHHDSACGWLSRGRYCGVILCCSIRLVLFHFVAAPFGVGLCPTVSGGVIYVCSTAWVFYPGGVQTSWSCTGLLLYCVGAMWFPSLCPLVFMLLCSTNVLSSTCLLCHRLRDALLWCSAAWVVRPFLVCEARSVLT
jgi:hypothetical protein